MGEFVKHATDGDFAAATAAGVTLVDFWADWCAPCRALGPTLDEVAEDYADTMRVVKVDIVANAATAERFAARSIPLLVMLRDGQETARMTGMISKTRLVAFIESNL